MQQDMIKEKQASLLVSRHKVFENKSSETKFVNRCKSSLRADTKKGEKFLFLNFVLVHGDFATRTKINKPD